MVLTMNEGHVRFGLFRFHPGTGELTREGVPVKLQAQPARVLSVLVANAGEIVSRETLQREVWGTATHVDFERGLNFCIAQVRSALKDTAESPRFVATVPRQGYRFIAPIQPADVTTVALPPDARHVVSPADPPPRTSMLPSRWLALGVVLLVALAAVGWRAWTGDGKATVIVVPFYNETGEPGLDGLAKSLADATVVRLATPERLPALSVIGNAPALRNPFARTDVQAIAQQLGAQWVVIGQLKRDQEQLRLVGHLIRSDDMKHVWAETFDDADFSLPAQERTAERIASAVSQALAKN